MKSLKGKITAVGLAIVVAGTPLVLTRCVDNKKIVCSEEKFEDIGFDKFADDISDMVTYLGKSYESGDEYDKVFGLIVRESSFKGIDNPLTIAFLKQYITEHGLVLDFDKEFKDAETGDITIDTTLGKLTYSTSVYEGGKCVSASVTSNKTFDETELEQNIFNYSAGCDVYFDLTKKGYAPKKVKISAGYTTKSDVKIPGFESNNYSEYIFCEDGYAVAVSKDGEVSLEHKYGTVEEYDNDHVGKVALSTIDENEVHTGLVTNLFLSGAPTSSAINAISKTRSSLY